ncbi:hypothetical protein LIER_17862 [Lithospermum erythrorhizon]|uniref:Conserved oligomeric Golgi complex subunit 4 N-terminal domain-containing protein n=1 Tax=Lithospermum erythrorhizon TaxID=34254 RepID=A0AAV3QED3_LITER
MSSTPKPPTTPTTPIPHHHPIHQYPEALTTITTPTDVSTMTRLLHEFLDIVKSDKDFMFNNVRTTNSLVDHVFAKVCLLDLAQSRLHDTNLRIELIVHRSNCLEGVKKSLQSDDLENGDNFVRGFLKIDIKFKFDPGWVRVVWGRIMSR